MTIIRNKAFAPKINPETGAISVPSKTTITLPVGSTFLNAEPSSSGGINIWHLAPELPGEDTKTEKLGLVAVRTGVDLPDEIAQCTHLKSFSGIHIFEVPAHLAKTIAAAKTGLESA